MLDELEWTAEHARLTPEERDSAVDDLIALVGAVDGILQAQSRGDAEYFARDRRPQLHGGARRRRSRRRCSPPIAGSTSSRACSTRTSARLLGSMTTPAQMARIQSALAPILNG